MEYYSLKEIFKLIANKDETAGVTKTILFQIRLPRLLFAFFIGAGLSVSGTVFQALLRNPLAEPHLIGVSSGAALGMTLAAFTLTPILALSAFTLPFVAFLGALASITLIYFLSKRKNSLSVYTLLLIGVILNSFFVSIIIFIESIANADELMRIFTWLLGNLSYVHTNLLWFVATATILGTLLLTKNAKSLNLLTLGENKATSLGLPVERTKLFYFTVASFITGIAVSVSGLIGFIGLVVPHITRLLFGSDNRLVLPASAFLGSILLVAADTLAKTILAPQEIPVGAITAFLGAPFFIYLLKSKESKTVLNK